MKKSFPLSIVLTTSAFAAPNPSAPTPPAQCYPAECSCYYCLGPVKTQGNAPVRPFTCNGDFTFIVAGFYWNAHQDGLEYAVKNSTSIQNINNLTQLQESNNLVGAHYEIPQSKWDFGVKLGAGYNSKCDGWDLGVEWTWYRARASSHIETELEDNQILIALWSNFNGRAGVNTLATDSETNWKVQLNLVDLNLGREFWASKYISLRPFVGLRLASIDQDYAIFYKGGSFLALNTIAYHDEVNLGNDFHGVGIRSGLDSNCNLGCGWSIYNNLGVSLVYGRFSIDHDEWVKQATSPFTETDLIDTSYGFKATRPMLDLTLGVQWSTMFCDCAYRFAGRIGWENHLFFDQNQLWRVNRVGGSGFVFPNDSGENVFEQTRGTFSTQGWTLTLDFAF